MAPILGVIFAILIGLASLPSLIAWQTQAKNNVNATTVAQQARQFIQASTQYIQTNNTTLQATATSSTPVIVTVGQLQAAGNLPSAFRTTNLFNQTWQLEVLQPTAGNIQSLITTTGGAVISDNQAIQIARLIGFEGGFFPKNDTGQYPGGASNAYGASWGPLPSAGYTSQAGHLALLINFNNGQLTDNRLYRNAVPGQPQLNTMTTPIIMASVQSENAACSTQGSFARDSTGATLNCVTTSTGLLWKKAGSSYWRDPVATYSALPSGDPSGSVRITIDTGRAFMWSGSSWTPLAADQNGNLSIPGNLDANTLLPRLKAAENTSCASYPEGTIAQSASNSGVSLSCQSDGTGKRYWKKSSGTGTGMRGILAPLAGMSISCSGVGQFGQPVISSAYVDNFGNPYTRISISYADSGWVFGFGATTHYFMSDYEAVWNISGLAGSGCSANWPMS